MSGPRAPVRATATVLEQRSEGAALRLRLAVPGWPGADPGQFVMLSTLPENGPERFDPLLPRPMAVLRSRAGSGEGEVEILYRVVGRGTAALARRRPGERLRLLGPLGRPFPLPPGGERAWLVGGGSGIASLLELARRARERAAEVRVLLGGRSKDQLFAAADFEALGVQLELATEDGSAGHPGLVTELLESGLAAGPRQRVYACGPEPMMERAARIAAERGVPCWVSLERRMACGIGVCLGCATPRRGGSFAIVCREGPVFEAGELVWGAGG